MDVKSVKMGAVPIYCPIRKVDSHGRIDVNGTAYFIRKKLEGQYVVATISTHRENK